MEWVLDSAVEPSTQEKKELVNSLAEQLDAEDEIEYGGEMKHQSTGDLVSVGVILVTSLDVLVNVYRIINDRDDSKVGIKQVNNEMFYIDDVEPTVVENNGGTVIENVEGDVFFTLPNDMENYAELIEEIREDEESEE
jgi:hypothetical protein